MKKVIFFACLFSFSIYSFGQNFAIGIDKNNFFYAGIDNPITVAVENVSMKFVALKASNGEIIKKNDGYYYHTTESGSTMISVYKIRNRDSIKIGSYSYRVRRIPNPIFKIGDGKDDIYKALLLSQQFVRAELEYFDFDIRYSVDSFKVCMFLTDSCLYREWINKGNKLTDEIRNGFKLLKNDDVIIFKNIFVNGPDGHREIAPRLIRIKE